MAEETCGYCEKPCGNDWCVTKRKGKVVNELIYGKDKTERIVSIDPTEDGLVLHFQDGRSEVRPASYWLLFAKNLNPKFKPLDGSLHYKYLMEYDSLEKYLEIRSHSYQKRYDFYSARSPVESAMIREGLTMFKGMKVEELSVLSFDIESNGIKKDDESDVYLISNTYRDASGKVAKKLFSVDEYASAGEMIDTWCTWVREMNPAVLLGHNIFGYDLPYLEHVAGRYGYGLRLGTDASLVSFASRVSRFRKDGSQSYEYFDCRVFGRQVIDTFFLAIKHDIARKYPSYGLKAIIEFEGLTKKGRQFYDAGSIRDNWNDLAERKKIKAYAIDDADDSLALFDLMISPYFYFTQSAPMPLQDVINRASGTQVNSVMLRSYIQDNHSVPQPSDSADYEGAISFGNPGRYTDCYKVDVASLYPSIILQYEVYDKAKDPKKNFLKIVEYFTNERLANKAKAKETGDRYFKDLEQSQKIMINSAYGFLGTKGLAFNAPDKAAYITRKGREILEKGISWAEKKGYVMVNADTDSFMYTGAPKKAYDFEADIVELNSLYPDKISWEDDGKYKRVLIVKAKNYVLDDGKKITTKGSALKASMKEPRLKDFLDETLDVLLRGLPEHVFSVYDRYAREIDNVTEIAPWCSKKTITEAVLKSDRTNESKIRDAIVGIHVSEGDKVYLFFESKDKLTLREEFTGVYCRQTLYGKLYKSLEIFGNLIDMRVFPNYGLKKNEKLLKNAS